MTNCKQCGKEFKQKFKREKFCSVKCYADNRKNPLVKLKCPTCDDTFYKKSYHVKEGKTYFCSRQCSSRSRKIHFEEVRACLYCGEEFTVLSKSKKRCCCCDCAAKIRSKNKNEKDFNQVYYNYVKRVDEHRLEELI